MARARRQAATFEALPRRRRWGCAIFLLFLALLAALSLVLLVWLVMPRRPLDPARLIGYNVDGLVLVDLNRASPRVEELVRALVRPLAEGGEEKPEEMEKEITRLLDVLTFRRAIGLMRYDPEAREEQWAWVVGLKRLGEPIRLLVRRIASREAQMVTTETLGGEVIFYYDEPGPYFAADPRAFVLANDRTWLREMLRRVKGGEPRTARAERLLAGLPAEERHAVLRAAVLFSPERWESWGRIVKQPELDLETLAEAHAFMTELGIRPPALNLLSLRATAEPGNRLRLDFRAQCDRTSETVEGARRMREQWPELAPLFGGPYLTSIANPTSGTIDFVLGWVTSPMEELLGVEAKDEVTTH